MNPETTEAPKETKPETTINIENIKDKIDTEKLDLDSG